jgi:hypothetical protein
MQSINRIERLSYLPLTAGSQPSVAAKVSGLTVTLLMTIAEFTPERSVVMQGKALGTSMTRFCGLEPVNGRMKTAVGGDVSEAPAWLARQGGKSISDEIAPAVETRIEGSE